MPFVPMELMMARVRKFGTDSDAALFHELLYAGEFIVKVTTAAVVAAIQDDRAHHRYGRIHALVRASSIGEWASKRSEMRGAVRVWLGSSPRGRPQDRRSRPQQC
jgi:hypothetical protein